MGDGSMWGGLGQWLAEPENRTVAWIGIGAATMFVLGLIGILTESPRYEQGVDTSGEGAGPGVAVLFVLLVLLGFVSMGVAAYTPGAQALVTAVVALVRPWVESIAHSVAGSPGHVPLASSPWVTLTRVAVLVGALVLAVMFARFVWRRGAWWRVTGATLVGLGLWVWFAPGQVAAVWAFVSAMLASLWSGASKEAGSVTNAAPTMNTVTAILSWVVGVLGVAVLVAAVGVWVWAIAGKGTQGPSAWSTMRKEWRDEWRDIRSWFASKEWRNVIRSWFESEASTELLQVVVWVALAIVLIYFLM